MPKPSSYVAKLYANKAASADSAAAMDCQFNGMIVGCLLELTYTETGTLVNNGTARMELSFGSTSSFVTNDVRNVIGGIESVMTQSSAANVLNNSRSVAIPYLQIPIARGERLFIHIGLANPGSVPSVTARAWIYIAG
jgi:hypothetical protein